jgi:hypothetical protein
MLFRPLLQHPSIPQNTDLRYVLIGCWFFCGIALVVSPFALKQVRFLLIFNSLAMGMFWMAIPKGIL